MTTVFAMLLASATVFPDIDRAALDRQASLETAKPAIARAVVRRASQPAPVRFVKAARGSYSIVAVCRAAGTARDSADFLAAFAQGYKLSRGEAAALRETCALYFTGRSSS